jgi:GTP-binding protein
LVHIIDISPYSQRDPVEDFFTVKKELEAFDPRLVKRTQIVVANKIDLLPGSEERLEKLERLAKKEGLPFFAISALQKIGLKQVIDAMSNALEGKQNDTYV